MFDVVGEVLSLNKVNLPDMLREVAYEPRRLDDYLDVIDRIDLDLLGRWARTVPCRRPGCPAPVPPVRRSCLRKKGGAIAPVPRIEDDGRLCWDERLRLLC